MPFEFIYPAFCLTFLAVWVLAGAIVVRDH